MIVAGTIGGGLFAVMSVVTLFLGDLGLVGTAVGFTVMMAAYALGQRADLKDLAVMSPHREFKGAAPHGGTRDTLSCRSWDGNDHRF